MFGVTYDNRTFNGGFSDMLQKSIDQGYKTIQIFMNECNVTKANINPHENTEENKLYLEDVDRFRKLTDKYSMICFAHAHFRLNVRELAIRPYKIKQVVTCMNLCDKMGITGYNIHIGSMKGLEHDSVKMKNELSLMAKRINSVLYKLRLKNNRVQFIIENEASGFTLKEIAEVIGRVNIRYSKRVGFCLDTAHLWGAGVIFGDIKHRLKYLLKLVKHNVLLVHLNGSRADYGSGRDIHGGIFLNSQIPTKSLLIFVKAFVELNTPFVLETKPSEERETEIIKLKELFT